MIHPQLHLCHTCQIQKNIHKLVSKTLQKIKIKKITKRKQERKGTENDSGKLKFVLLSPSCFCPTSDCDQTNSPVFGFWLVTGKCSRICCTAGSNPMSNIRSASSITKYVHYKTYERTKSRFLAPAHEKFKTECPDRDYIGGDDTFYCRY